MVAGPEVDADVVEVGSAVVVDGVVEAGPEVVVEVVEAGPAVVVVEVVEPDSSPTLIYPGLPGAVSPHWFPWKFNAQAGPTTLSFSEPLNGSA